MLNKVIAEISSLVSKGQWEEASRLFWLNGGNLLWKKPEEEIYIAEFGEYLLVKNEDGIEFIHDHAHVKEVIATSK